MSVIQAIKQPLIIPFRGGTDQFFEEKAAAGEKYLGPFFQNFDGFNGFQRLHNEKYPGRFLRPIFHFCPPKKFLAITYAPDSN